MILVQHLSIIHAAKHASWHVELGESNESLYDNQDECNQAHNAVDVGESSLWVARLVHLDDDQPGNESYCSAEIERKMDVSSCRLLLLG